MSGLIIDSEACIGCGRCVRACASGGIVVEGDRPNRCARVTDGCILCGGCVDACPANAISIERDEAAVAADLDAYRDIWVFVQTDEHDTVTSVAYELMGKGRELADARGCRLVALAGMGTEGSLGDLEHLVCAGADEVLVCRDERLRQNDAEVYARLICDLVAERKPEAILYGATAFGRELAPGVAVRLQTGLTADCTVLSMDAETGLLQMYPSSPSRKINNAQVGGVPSIKYGKKRSSVVSLIAAVTICSNSFFCSGLNKLRILSQ